MPPVSKSQSRYMRAVAHGDIKNPSLSPKQAEEYVSGYPTKDLPEKTGEKKDGRPGLRKLAAMRRRKPDA